MLKYLLFITILVFTSCGGGSSSTSDTSTSITEKAFLLDSAVEGVQYSCKGYTGITNSIGELHFNRNCGLITFKVGEVIISQIDSQTIPKDNKIFITDLAGVQRYDIESPKVIKILSFLQSLDEDQNASNNIKITSKIRSKLAFLKKNLLDSNTSLTQLIEKDTNKTVLSQDIVIKHFKNTLGITANKNTAYIGEVYTWSPLLENNNTNKSFSIQNLPKWASFNTKTGTISGIPKQKELDTNIIITVRDSGTISTFQPFNISVKEKIDLAYFLGTATQGSTYDNLYPASNAIDGNDSTFNYTQNNNLTNWLQIELPKEANISQISILGNNKNPQRLKNTKVYLSNIPYSNTLNTYDLITTLEPTEKYQITNFLSPKTAKYLIIKANENNYLELNSVKIFGTIDTPPILKKSHYTFDININTTIGSFIAKPDILNFKDTPLTYTVPSNLPFSIDQNGTLKVAGNLEIKTYDFNITVNDGKYTVNIPISIYSKRNTQNFDQIKNDFLTTARLFDANYSLTDLITKYLNFAQETAKDTYDKYMQTPLPQTFWDFIANDDYLKEGLYASIFPANPYVVKNLYDFNQTLKSDFTKYKNLALGLSINAKESGIFSKVRFGDTSDHPTIDYTKISQYQEKENRWKEHFDFANLGYDISYYDFQKYLTLKYNLEDSEKDSLYSASSKFKAMSDDGISIETADYETRKKYNLSFAELNLYRLTHKMQRADCSSTNQPCYRIDNFIQNKGLTKSQFLADFGKYKNDTTLGLINPRDNFADFLRGELGVIPKDKNDYRLMSFKDLANWKIMLDNIEAVDFGDKEPNWPIFKTKLQDTPWQIFALEQSAQKQECGYIKQRFFETDKSKLEASYPPNAVDGGAKKDRRFIEYTTYTWDYNNPKVWYRESEWTPNRSYYRILQDGGVCGRQSTMGQHANECLNRPSIGTGQPGHRAWIGIYNRENDQNQLYTKIGYRVGSYESATPHSNTIYNHYTKKIRESGMEKFTGVVTGTSSANSGERTFNKSMILQHIAKIMEDENSSSVEVLLKKAITIAPTNVDAWYQLALYYATQDKYQKVIDLAKYFMDTRDNFFLDLDSKDGADNLEIVTAKNIAFAINFAPSINFGKGDKAEEGKTLLWNYLDTYENTLRSIRSYRDQNRYLSNLYLVKLNDQTTFISEIKNLFSNFLVHGGHKNYYTDYFNGVDFHDINKTQLFDDLETMTQQADLTDTPHDRTKIIEKLLGRSTTSSLAEISIKDICLNNNLKECQSIKSFELDAKAVYIITTNNVTGEDKEVDPTNRGEEGYSTLVIPAVDENGNDLDIKVRAAKIATTEGINGKLLKINDPTEVQTDKTKIILWIDPSDNTLAQGKVYHSSSRILLKAKKRVTNNEEFMGDVIIDIQNLLKGNSYTFNGSDFFKTYKDDTTSVYFVTNDSKIGPTKGVWWTSGHTILNIKVKDNNNNEKTLKLRATNDDNYLMNSGLSAGWTNTFKLTYDSSDNNLTSGTRYKSILPTTIDALMWHKQGRIKDRMYINIDFTIP